MVRFRKNLDPYFTIYTSGKNNETSIPSAIAPLRCPLRLRSRHRFKQILSPHPSKTASLSGTKGAFTKP